MNEKKKNECILSFLWYNFKQSACIQLESRERWETWGRKKKLKINGFKFPKYGENHTLTDQSSVNPNQGKTTKITTRYIIVKLLKNQDKENLEDSQNKRTDYIQDNSCRVYEWRLVFHKNGD